LATKGEKRCLYHEIKKEETKNGGIEEGIIDWGPGNNRKKEEKAKKLRGEKKAKLSGKERRRGLTKTEETVTEYPQEAAGGGQEGGTLKGMNSEKRPEKTRSTRQGVGKQGKS